MARKKDANWSLNDKITTWEEVQVALLMDIRDELKNINRRLDCQSTLMIPNRLQNIEAAVQRTDKRLAKKIKLNQGR